MKRCDLAAQAQWYPGAPRLNADPLPPPPPSFTPLPPPQVESLPPHLLSARVSLADFMAVHHMQRKMHSLQVALDFYQQVGRGVRVQVGCGGGMRATRWGRAGGGVAGRAGRWGALAAGEHDNGWGRAGMLRKIIVVSPCLDFDLISRRVRAGVAGHALLHLPVNPHTSDLHARCIWSGL